MGSPVDSLNNKSGALEKVGNVNIDLEIINCSIDLTVSDLQRLYLKKKKLVTFHPTKYLWMNYVTIDLQKRI